MNGFTSRTEAIYRQIVEPLSSDPDITIDFERDAETQVRDLYDVDAIADAVIGDYDEGYLVTVDDERFWDIVRENAR